MKTFLAQHFDWRSGVKAGALFALIVFLINVFATDPINWTGSATAAIKQFVYTFLIGSWLFGLAQWVSGHFRSPVLGICVSTVLVGSFASALILGMHSLRGTPEPLLSSLPAIIVGLVIVPALLMRKQGLMKNRGSANGA